MKNLKVNQKISHKGTNENANKTYTVKIIGFDRMAINVRNDNGDSYWMNEWEISKVHRK